MKKLLYFGLLLLVSDSVKISAMTRPEDVKYWDAVIYGLMSQQSLAELKQKEAEKKKQEAAAARGQKKV